MKLAKRKLTKSINIAYLLTKENGEYTIHCIEENTSEHKTNHFKAQGISSSEKTARRIFNQIVRYKVFGDTLLDVIYNLLE
ncbi:MAG: hypothetical protein IJ437_03790 [Clostridia bacterium]|nr:hypothetical protein [Clostridia bacterium]